MQLASGVVDMSAKEMFKALGWHDESKKYPACVCLYKKHDAIISFFNDGIYGNSVEAEVYGESYQLDMEELSAVYQQCKELGWIDG
jgi:hypothetical protein